MKAIGIGDTFIVRNSKRLEQNGHSHLINKKGVVTRILKSEGRILGVYADFVIFRKTKNYYVPFSSIEGPGHVSKERTLSIIKSTTL